MTSETKPLGPAAPAPEADLFTLEPLRTDGPDALRTEPGDGIADLTLHKLQVVFEGLPHTAVTSNAENFSGSTGNEASTDPPPRAAKLSSAVLTFHVQGSPVAHMAEIHPPRKLKTTTEEDTRLLRRFLAKRHFLIPQHLAKAAAVLLACFATLLPDPPAEDDNEGPRRYRFCSY